MSVAAAQIDVLAVRGGHGRVAVVDLPGLHRHSRSRRSSSSPPPPSARLSLWGYTTKRDISGWGSFLFMGLIGIILASVVNIFLQSTGLQFAVSVIGVLVFAGLTAYDTQRIKDGYTMVAGNAERGRQERHHGRSQPVPRLHQHVHDAAQLVRQPRVSGTGAALNWQGPRSHPRPFAFLPAFYRVYAPTRRGRPSSTVKTRTRSWPRFKMSPAGAMTL